MKKYYSEICEVMHQDAMADFELGIISEARMREYDELCFVEEDETEYKENSVIKEAVTAVLV